MTSSLSEYVVLQSKYNGKYLEYVKEEGPVQGYVRFSGEGVHSPLSKFHVERSGTEDSRLVHLRCCYNNKCLVASTPLSPWIVSGADKPEEDQSKSSCTLFQTIPCGGDDYLFKHMKSGSYAVLMRTGDSDPKNNCLYPAWGDPNSDLCDVCTVIDWKTLLVLPRHVAFKGDNDKYLSVPILTVILRGSLYLQFATSDSGDIEAAHEVFPNPDGSIRLKSTICGKFWRGSPDWILADSPDTSTGNRDTLFWPVKINENTIALRNLGSGNLCKRKDDYLSVVAYTVSKETHLQVTELVRNRDIFNVNYHMSRARRYNECAVVMATETASNTTDRENSMDLTVAHTETKTNKWGGSVSLMLGVKTTLKTGIPMILDGKIEISAELTTAVEWGKEDTKTNTIQTVYKASVPPMTKITITAVGTTAMCDIPFSYSQTDTLMDGTHVSYEKDGGTYTGVSTFNVTYQIKEEKINITE